MSRNKYVSCYQEAAWTLKDRDRLKVHNNTYLVRDGDTIRLVLHSTSIITYRSDDSYKLNSGGWRTITTKSRMNDYLPGNIKITQSDFEWYVTYGKITIPFHDGILIYN